MSMTKCRYCNDEHICHVENDDSALVAELLEACDKAHSVIHKDHIRSIIAKHGAS